jgi:hypothetical protein
MDRGPAREQPGAATVRLSRRAVLAGGVAGLSAVAVRRFVGIDLGGGLPAVFMDAHLVRSLRLPENGRLPGFPVLQVLAHCRDLDFADLTDQVRRAGRCLGLLQPASHLLVLEAVRDVLGRVTLDVAAAQVRPADLGGDFCRLSAAATQVDATVRALAAECG